MATPHVTGAIALYQATNPGADADAVRAWPPAEASRP
jgi:hypothetical protein